MATGGPYLRWFTRTRYVILWVGASLLAVLVLFEDAWPADDPRDELGLWALTSQFGKVVGLVLVFLALLPPRRSFRPDRPPPGP